MHVILIMTEYESRLRLDHCHSWWRHQMETFSTLLALCAGNSSVTGEFPAQRPIRRSFDVFSDLHLSKRLSNRMYIFRLHCYSNAWFDIFSNVRKQHKPTLSLFIHDEKGSHYIETVCWPVDRSNFVTVPWGFEMSTEIGTTLHVSRGS